MSFHVFDTYRREKVEFVPLHPGEVRMYNCGPTVYDYAHIGNFRAYIFADLLRRWLEVSGYTVHQVMNLTDVDDKTIQRSREQNTPLAGFTAGFKQAFFEDIEALNIKRAEHYPAATEHIESMVKMIQSLLEGGYAYRAEDGSLYFRVAGFPDYGRLSGKRLADLRIGRRVRSDEYESKDDVRDFALWKAWDEEDGDIFWETPLGKGRPGWHIECSAMSTEYLGDEFDIHTGGVDNIFPHHENEIAQSVCATGARFVRYWMHCEYLIVEGRKMSKSLGNYYTLRDLFDKGWKAREIRYVLIGTHYRSPLNFTFEGLGAARAALERLDEFRRSWDDYPEGPAGEEVRAAVERAGNGFDDAMNDDLNVSPALAAVFNLVREVNAAAARGGVTTGDRELLDGLWRRWDDALGVLHPFPDEEAGAPVDVAWIEGKIAERAEAREAKDWARADAIRDELLEAGIELRDGPSGTTWTRK